MKNIEGITREEVVSRLNQEYFVNDNDAYQRIYRGRTISHLRIAMRINVKIPEEDFLDQMRKLGLGILRTSWGAVIYDSSEETFNGA